MNSTDQNSTWTEKGLMGSELIYECKKKDHS
mgnify:CR=1 FL=1